MEALLIAVMGVMCIACFLVGARVGQKVSKGEEVTLPNLNPIEAIREHQERREVEREQDRFDTILRNIDAYDGTGNGQQDVG